MFRYATLPGLEDGQVTSLLSFALSTSFPDISHWVHTILQTSAQSDLLIRRLVVRLPVLKVAYEHIDCAFVLACLYRFDLLQGVDLPLSIVGMAHECKLAQEFTGT